MKQTAASALDGPVPRQPRPRPANRGRATPHQLLVAGVDAADIVTGAGGLICDSVRAGLEVKVYLEINGDERALRILGVHASELPARFDFESEWPDAVLFTAGLHKRHQGIRRLVADAVRRRRADVGVWGGTWPMEDATGVGIEHRLSTAARAFKSHAMLALGKPAHISPTEPFRSGVRSLVDVPSPLPRR
ncbi:hypothetical protein GGC64_003441 [Mycobacterium sp. OAS707]|nr:hypothetical protein [Mycobacterium sp. OAS707]